MAVIRDYVDQYGATIRIHDDYMVKTPEENKAIVKQMSRIINSHFAAEMNKQQCKEEQSVASR